MIKRYVFKKPMHINWSKSGSQICNWLSTKFSLSGWFLSRYDLCQPWHINKVLTDFNSDIAALKSKEFSYGKIGQKPTIEITKIVTHTIITASSVIQHIAWKKPFRHQSICFKFWPAITYLSRGISKNLIWYILKKRVFW